MKNLVFGFSIIFFVLISSFAHGQNRLLRGMVTTFDSIPLINASVYIKSTKEKVLTDSIGAFKIYCNTPDKIKVTANGFIPRNVKVDENIKFVLVNLKLKSSDDAKEIAIGYGHVKDAEKLSAVEALKSKDVDFSMYKDVYDIIRGRFSGVTVEGNDIIIRGKSSFISSNAALVIVDGMPIPSSTLSSIVPSNIKSINILKDGSASIYGVRGANGVVIIETKRGGD